jgi:zinc protease
VTGWNREVNVTSIDGVPVVWADASGPLRATLMFRVGRTDERLPWSGITHLVEHLALFQLGPQQRYEFNGAVTSNRTVFYATGTPAEIVSFLAVVTAALGNLPLDRAETEKTVLLAEASSRSMSAGDFMFSLRFGTRGNGLHRYREFGLHHVPAAWIAGWSARYFNRDNAVLWLSGPPPSDLRLTLAAGQRMPESTVQPLALSLPAYAQAPVGGAGVSMVAPRSTALSMATNIGAARLLKRLRFDKGIAYSVLGGYFPMDREQAHVSLWTDAQPGQSATVLTDTVQAMYGMSSSGPTGEELATEVDAMARNFDREDAAMVWLDRTAVRMLNGEPAQGPADLLADMQTVTPTAARDAMSQAVKTAIYLGPEDVATPAGINRYVPTVVQPVRGQGLQHVHGRLWRHPPTLIVTNEGVTLDINGAEDITVRYDSCEAVLRYRDYGICLVGFDGSSLPVNPKEWPQGIVAIQQVMKYLAPDRVVPMPPAETTALAIRVPEAAKRKLSSLRTFPWAGWIALIGFAVVAVALVWFAIFGTIPGIGTGPPFISLVVWSFLGYRLLRRFR